jgi:trimeric autotransporter adhesin
MKTINTIFKSLLLLIAICNLQTAFSQAPQKMSYQAIIRNSSNVLIANTSVTVKVSILENAATGFAVYSEVHLVATNYNGLATFNIGTGTVLSGSFSAIDWANGNYFVKTETDPTAGTNYTIVGVSQLTSVPYALSSGDNKWTSNGIDILNKNSGNIGIGTGGFTPSAYGYSGTNKVVEISNNGVSNSQSQLVLSSEINGIGNIGGITFVDKNSTLSEKRMAAITANYNDGNIDDDGDGSYQIGSNLDFITNENGVFSKKMTIKRNGNTGIGTTTPTAKLEVNGFTKLGNEAPAIKIKKLTGTTAATQGGTSSVTHGLDSSKILSITVFIEPELGTLISSSIGDGFGLKLNFVFDTTSVSLTNTGADSVNILSKPFKIMVTYEE